MYGNNFSDAMNYFRAIIKADERSERALKLTQHVVELNAANYTAWHFRRVCIEALGKNVADELAYVTSMAGENPKNYQIWYHRRLMVQKDPAQAKAELAFCEAVFQEDGKNYHAWAHRQWVIENHSLWEDEKGYLDNLLLVDIRNNSAWNQRYWVVSKTGDLSADLDLCKQEIQWAIGHLRLAVNNESPWNYIMGIVRASKYVMFTNTCSAHCTCTSLCCLCVCVCVCVCAHTLTHLCVCTHSHFHKHGQALNP
jgi:protein farnesyltransferase/geranylgeranyltransferase type-1 subunit alpha